MWVRPAVAFLVVTLCAACGGITDDHRSSSSSSGSSSGGGAGSSSGGASSSSGGSSGGTGSSSGVSSSSSGGSSSSSGGTVACVNIDPAGWGTSCVTDTQCTTIPSGQICSGSCGCSDIPTNIDGQKEFQDELAANHIQLAACPCPPQPPVACIAGHCQLAPIASGRAHE